VTAEISRREAAERARSGGLQPETHGIVRWLPFIPFGQNRRPRFQLPVTWKEVERGVEIEDFTMMNVPRRLKKVGDLWEPAADKGPCSPRTLPMSLPNPQKLSPMEAQRRQTSQQVRSGTTNRSGMGFAAWHFGMTARSNSSRNHRNRSRAISPN